MQGWSYHGANVQVPRTADIPTPYRFGKRHGDVVQQVLDQMPHWQEGEDPIETMQFSSQQFPCIVIPNEWRNVIWAKHRGHWARDVQVSPFVRAEQGSSQITDRFTIELVQSPERPKLVRAYPGDYIPPLPWQNSARWADGGREACIEFWRSHAYVYHPGVVVDGSICSDPPPWFFMTSVQ